MSALKVIAHNPQGYTKTILEQDDRQVWNHDTRVKGRCGERGMFIDPKDFPEMESFEIILLKDWKE